MFKQRNVITFDRFIIQAFQRHFCPTWQPESDCVSYVFSSKTQDCVPWFSKHMHPSRHCKERRLHRQVKWQIQVARRNINSFRTSEQQASCQRERGRERSKGLTPDMTDALETRARQLILCVWVWVCACVFILQHLLCVFNQSSGSTYSLGFRITMEGTHEHSELYIKVISSIFKIKFTQCVLKQSHSMPYFLILVFWC